MRTHQVAKARTSPGKCEKCGTVIKAGQPYRSIAAFRGPKQIRCGKCPDWRPSERTSSDKLSRLYAARESVEDALEGFDPGDGDASDLRDALESAGTEAEDVAQEYRDAAEAWNGSGPASDWEEKADQCDSWSQELNSAAGDIEDFDDDAAKVEAEDESEQEREPKPEGTDNVATPADPAEPLSAEAETVVGDAQVRDIAPVTPPVEDDSDTDEAVKEKVDEKRDEWADDVRDKVQAAIDALEL